MTKNGVTINRAFISLLVAIIVIGSALGAVYFSAIDRSIKQAELMFYSKEQGASLENAFTRQTTILETIQEDIKEIKYEVAKKH